MELSDSLNIDIEINSDDNFTCSICMEEIDIENKCITNCNHEFCKKCLHDWFKKNKISCPTCRQDIEEYNNMNVRNHIVQVKEENTENNLNVLSPENERILRHLQSKIYKLNMFICFNISYLLYNVYNETDKQVKLLYYENQYENCSTDLNTLQASLEDQTDILVYTNDEITKCYFPTKYLTDCLST
jgi:hypothetical protein